MSEKSMAESTQRNRQPLRILFAVSMPYPEGRSDTRRIRTLTRELARQGHEIEIFLPFSRNPQPAVQWIDGVRVRWGAVPSSASEFMTERGRVRLWVQFTARLKWLVQLWSKSRHGEYEWLYLYQPGFDALFAVLIARCWGRRVCSEYVDVLSSIGYKGFVLKLIYLFQVLADRMIPALSHQILVISSTLERIHRQHANHAAIMRFPILVDTQRFGSGQRNKFRQQLNLGDCPIVAYTGSFAHPQGLRVLIEAMAGVVVQKPAAMLLIAGGSLAPDADDADLLLQQNNLMQNARYLGMLGESDVIDLQAAADVLVMPKLDDPINHAGLSTKFAEYLASGNAVVASNVGDISLYVAHGQDVCLVPAGDRRALESALLKLLEQDALRHWLGSNGRQVAQQAFDVRVQADKLVRALKERASS
jgi:glycosyltransferase involved in cell wall biosynthesis